MGEMRRMGTGGTVPPGAAQARLPARGGARNLAERVAQARTGAPTVRTAEDPLRSAEAKPVDAAIGKGRNGKAQPAVAPPTPAPPAISGDNPPIGEASAAEMPKAPEIPEKRRRPSLIDRITGLGKG